MVERDVQSAIDEVIRERMDSLKIISVSAEREDVAEGDQILRVTIVVDNQASDFDRKRLSSLVRYIRVRLSEVRETAFPLISFMSKADAEALAP